METIIEGFNLGVKYGAVVGGFMLCVAFASSIVTLTAIVTNIIQNLYKRRRERSLTVEALELAHRINKINNKPIMVKNDKSTLY